MKKITKNKDKILKIIKFQGQILMKKMSVIINIDGRCVIFETADIERFFAHANRPAVIEFVLDVQKVGVVEKIDGTGFGNDSLAEEIRDVLANVTT